MTPSNWKSFLTDAERARLAALDTPRKIQDFLDSVTYEPEYFNRSPLRVLRELRGHCLDGAIFGAAALELLGHPPVVVDLLPAPLLDDDHVLAVYRIGGGFGALAKSNTTGLRYREPIYRSLRELVMSYFEDYYNIDGFKTLRGYTAPLRLNTFEALDWTCNDAGVDAIEKRFKDLRRYELLTPEMVRNLSKMDRRAFDAGFMGADWEGLFKPGIA